MSLGTVRGAASGNFEPRARASPAGSMPASLAAPASGSNGLDRPTEKSYSSLMKQASVTELKNQLSRYLRLVKRGETIEILEHSVPVARLEGVQGRGADRDSHLER